MGQEEVKALVRRLRGVAVAERHRRAFSISLDDSGSGINRRGRGEASVTPQVEAMMLELKRVAVHGDATTLDVLLSSQVRVIHCASCLIPR